MKTEMRQKLAHLSFEEKIRKVGQLVRLSRKIKAQQIGEPGGARQFRAVMSSSNPWSSASSPRRKT